MFTGKQKAVAAFVITLLGGIITTCLTTFPDNPTVQTWGGLIAGVLTILATTVGVYQTSNTQPQATLAAVNVTGVCDTAEERQAAPDMKPLPFDDSNKAATTNPGAVPVTVKPARKRAVKKAVPRDEA